ncbi:unnamed protein product [Lampetra fluviatilis]
MEARGSPGQFARRKYLHNGRSGGEEYDVPTSAGNLAPRRTKTTAGTQKELEASGSCSVAARPSAAGHGADAEEPCDVAGKSSSKNAARDLGRFPSLPPGFRASPVVPLCRVREGRQEEQSGDTRRAPRGSARSCKDSLCQRNNPAMWLWVVVVSNNESSSGSRKALRATGTHLARRCAKFHVPGRSQRSSHGTWSKTSDTEPNNARLNPKTHRRVVRHDRGNLSGDRRQNVTRHQSVEATRHRRAR